MLQTIDSFVNIQFDSELDIEFDSFALLLKKLLTRIATPEPVDKTFACFELGAGEDASGEFKFFQDSEWSVLSLLRFKMDFVDEEELKNNVTFKIHSKTQKTKMMQQRLKDILDLVLQTNPALLNEIVKGKDVMTQQSISGPSFSQQHQNGLKAP